MIGEAIRRAADRLFSWLEERLPKTELQKELDSLEKYLQEQEQTEQ